MNSLIQDLQIRREELSEQLRGFVGQMEGDDWTPEQQVEFEARDAEYEDVKGQIEVEIRKEKAAQLQDRLKADEERSKAAYRSTAGQARMERQHGPLVTSETRSLALQAFALSNNADSRQLEAAAKCGVNHHAKEIDIRCLFNASLNWDGDQCWSGRSVQAFAEKKLHELRQQATDPGNVGGFTVPQGMMQAIEVAMLQFGAMRQVATVIRTENGRQIPWPTVNDTTNKAVIVDENAPMGQQDVVFGQVTTKPFKYGTKYVPVSIELLQDSATNMEQLLGRLLGERMGRGQNEHHTVGAGTTEPTGITVAASSSSVVLGTAGSPTYDELIDLKHSVDPAYRQMGHGWMFSDSTLGNIKKIKSDDGMPIWKSGLAPEAPDTIDGDPYVVNQDMPSGLNARSIVYGQLNKYIIHDGMSFTLRRLEELHALNGQVTFLAWARTDGALLDAGTKPVKYAANPAG